MFDQAHEDFLAGREYAQAAEDRTTNQGPPDRVPGPAPLRDDLASGRHEDSAPPCITSADTARADRAERALDIAQAFAGRRAAAAERRPHHDYTRSHVLFVDRVLSWHRPVTSTAAPWPMCSCGRAGRCCPYLEAAREFFPGTHQLPWEPLAESERGRP